MRRFSLTRPWTAIACSRFNPNWNACLKDWRRGCERNRETSNNQHPTPNIQFSSAVRNPSVGCWMLDVGCSIVVLLFVCTLHASAAPVTNRFNAGVAAYQAGDFSEAARAFRDSAAAQPASGTFQNLGNAE